MRSPTSPHEQEHVRSCATGMFVLVCSQLQHHGMHSGVVAQGSRHLHCSGKGGPSFIGSKPGIDWLTGNISCNADLVYMVQGSSSTSTGTLEVLGRWEPQSLKCIPMCHSPSA